MRGLVQLSVLFRDSVTAANDGWTLSASSEPWKAGRAVGTTCACPPRTVATMRLLRLIYAFCAWTCLLEMLAGFAQEFFTRDVEAAILFGHPNKSRLAGTLYDINCVAALLTQGDKYFTSTQRGKSME